MTSITLKMSFDYIFLSLKTKKFIIQAIFVVFLTVPQVDAGHNPLIMRSLKLIIAFLCFTVLQAQSSRFG